MNKLETNIQMNMKFPFEIHSQKLHLAKFYAFRKTAGFKNNRN